MRLATMAVAVVVLGGAARAQEGPAAELAAPPEWSVGAGVGLVFVSGGLASLGSAAPTPTVSFERLFGEHFSLGLGLTASYRSQASQYVGNQALTGPLGTVSVALAPRWTVTPPTAPVAFSVYLSAAAGYSALSVAYQDVEVQGSHGFTYTFAGGVAVERRLIDRLALRLGVQLVHVDVYRSFYRTASNPDLPLTPASWSQAGVDVGVLPSPSLELRVYF